MTKVLTIAGSDSCCGAGIQADIKTISALGGYALSAICAVTAQNTCEVKSAFNLPLEIIKSQIDAVFEDCPPHSLKCGMLSSAEIIAAVADLLAGYRAQNIVIDPVMVSKSGFKLLEDEAVEALKFCLLPLADIATPNIPEAEILADMKINSLDDMRMTARKIHALGVKNVLVKGGHLPGDSVDILFDGADFYEFAAPRIITKNTHGTGCTLSAAIAFHLGDGCDIQSSTKLAKAYVTGAIENSLNIGRGHGPLGHFWNK